MSDLNKWLGIAYEEGKNDCFFLIRNYLIEVYGIWTPNVARPSDFWEDPHLDLYSLYKQTDFQNVFDDHLRVGDILLMPYGTRTNTHAAIVVEGNQILHALPQQLSCLDPLRPRWGRRANVVLRHPKIARPVEGDSVHIHEVIDVELFKNPEFQAAAKRALDGRS